MSDVVKFRDRVENPDRFLETCEGGDIGTPDKPSIWIIGQEPGWSKANERADGLSDAAGEAYRAKVAIYSVELQLTWPYNRAIFQILAALNGGNVRDFEKFAMQARPFEKGSSGYFKGNLFPEPFNKIGNWDDEARSKTGFSTKEEYRKWIRGVRFPIFKSRVEAHRPKLLIGVGLQNLDDFLEVAQSDQSADEHTFEVNGHSKRLYLTRRGIVPLAVLPHVSSGAHGLNSHRSREVAAELIKGIVELA